MSDRRRCRRFNISSLLLFLVLSMLSCRCRIRKVHGAWIFPSRGSRSSRRGAIGGQWRGGCNIPTSYYPSFQRQGRRIQSFALNAKWIVGEDVSVRVDDDFLDGVIREIRGGGWYNVQLSGSEDIIKCRGSQLRQSATTASSEDTVLMFTAANKTRPVIIASNDALDGMEPPSTDSQSAPTIHDLDAAISEQSLDSKNLTKRDRELLKQIAYHATFEKWVVFTDLHCSPSSLETCLAVLKQVHTVAVERNAGVLFLGDFWHHRGTLRVDCLNAVLEHFRTWEVPMIMIPGNHDQVTLGGSMHGLTPIENAYRVGIDNVPGPLVLTYTTKFRDALFIPHIRDVATMESILQSQSAKNASALFVHADVKGAMMNDLVVSIDGIPPSSFPPEKLIYSGHFHKPHTVKSAGVKIEYLGSPYETSLAEAQQPKTLAILDSRWQCVEYYPLDIGRRHFKVGSWRELLNLHLVSPGVHGGHSVDTVKAGDRIVATVTREEVRSIQPAVSAHIRNLRESGIMVEIREKRVVVDAIGNSEDVDTSKLDELTPESTWRKYLGNELAREAITSGRMAILLNEGFEILNELESSPDMSMESPTILELRLNNVSLRGFGPFQEAASYPLLNRGLVLLKGVNNDGGSDSNGSGKSSLAMAALWALTGSLDPRRAADAKVADIVNDASKTAEVSLEGTVNGEAFSITRTKTTSKGSLVFKLNGEDLTTQSIKETQLVIEEKLGINLRILSRTIFNGQHSINELLETTDASFKDELSLVVPISLWQKAASLSRAKSRATGKRISELTGMISMRSEDMEKLLLRLDKADQVLKEKQSTLKATEMEFSTDRQSISASEDDLDDFNIDDIERQMETALELVRDLEHQHDTLTAQRDADLSPLQRSLNELGDSIASLAARCSQEERDVYAATLRLDVAKTSFESIEEKWSVDLSNGIDTISINPELCPTCRQPLYAEGIGHSHEELESIARSEIANTNTLIEQAKKEVKSMTAGLESCTQSLVAREKTKSELESVLERESRRWDEECTRINDDIQKSRNLYGSLTEQLAQIAKKSQMESRHDTAQVSIDTAKSAVEFAAGVYDEIRRDLKDGEERLENLQKEIDEENESHNILLELADMFGQRGVQAFVLQSAVEALEALTQTYLDDLSDGAQRLRLTLDAADRITRTAFVSGAGGDYKERPLAALSGGQWRKCSLALSFGFAELLARKGKLRPSLLVLDEPLQHLDRLGRAKVGEVIRNFLRPAGADGLRGFGGLGISTVIVILQDLAAEELDEAFDCIDEVVKTNSQSNVKIDELSSA